MKQLNTILIIVLSLLLMNGCESKKQSNKVENVAAFARLYGYVRWFHPSDEAQTIDWDKFAVLGIQKVENIRSSAELADTLLQLFSPIVPGLELYSGKRKEQLDPTSLQPAKASGNKLVAWQHFGVYLGEKSNIYKSTRTYRCPGDAYSYFVKSIIDASQLRGKEIKLSGYIKQQSSQPEGKAMLFLCPMTKGEMLNPFTKLLGKETVAVHSSDWKKYEITLEIPGNTEYIHFGGALQDDVSLLADNFSLFVKKGQSWEAVNSPNLDFEKGEVDLDIGSWHFIEDWHTVEINDEETHSGKYALKAHYTGRMFKNTPEFGEYVHEFIGGGLNCVIPLALYDVKGNTYPATNSEDLHALKNQIAGINSTYGFHMPTNLASVLISWNVIQHFFPYHDVIEANWEALLEQTLTETYTNKDNSDFFRTLSKLIARLEDGHGVVYGQNMSHLPLRTELIEDRIVITASEHPDLKTGDIIKEVNGKSALQVQSEMEKLISGSPQLRQHRALNVFGSTLSAEELLLLTERDGEEKARVANTGRGSKSIFFNRISDNENKETGIEELEEGIYYVNLSYCTSEEFNEQIDELATAKSVIYDNRWGQSLNFFEIIPHLIDTVVRSPWWNIPQVIYPNREELTFEKRNWTMQPQQPEFSSKSIILNAPCVVSSGETEMGIIDHYKLATTVGEATAGCNGNVNWIELPNGFRIMWTGMKVLKHDESQHYLVGYQPDYPIKKTLEAVKAGRDQALEKALEIARDAD